MTEKAFRLRASVELLDEIAKLAQKYGRRSSNQVMVEILENYKDLWAAAEQAKMDEIARQRRQVLGQRERPTRKQPDKRRRKN
ncbi:MAG TPA: hypothetical protein VNO70_10200 [Blastocatellia bacterium]|nr:hypothetical protein [Blastocatellia bacterium]